MQLKQKFSFKTFVFMIASVFKVAPVLFPLLILVRILTTILGVVALYVLKDATNFVSELLTNNNVLNETIIATFVYLLLLLVVEALLVLCEQIIESYYYKNADRYFRSILLYKLGKMPQERLYDKETYDKYNFSYANLYVFQQLPYHVLFFTIDFSFSKLVYIGVIFSFNVFAGLISLFLVVFRILYAIIFTKKKVDLNKRFNNDERKKNNYMSLITQKNTIKETKVNRLENYFFNKQD